MPSNSVLKRKLNNIKNDETLSTANKRVKIAELETELINNIQNNERLSDSEKKLQIREILIRSVQHNTDIPKQEKVKLYQSIMFNDYNNYLKLKESLRCNIPYTHKSFNSRVNNILGCRHYKKNCKIYTRCCNKWYVCKFCHNNKENHTLDVENIEKIVCMECKTIQEISNKCSNDECGIEFAEYFCDICKYHNNEKDLDIYHCNKCNMCIKGSESDFTHCNTCNMCMHISIINNHKCIDNRNDSTCPICNIMIKDSPDEPMILEKCNHIIHINCFNSYILSNYKCPICIKTITDFGFYKTVFNRYDEILEYERYQIPDEYRNAMARIHCNDCEEKSETRYHFELHKCQNDECNSYNTSILSIEKNYYESSDDESGSSSDDEIIVDFFDI